MSDRGDKSSGSEISAGHRIEGKYELVEVAGTGGMATVWRAIQRGPGRFRRLVAVKHMHPHLAVSDEYREMFFEEARVGGVLRDPNLAQVQDFIEADDQLYLIMEWVEGIDLATYGRFAATIGEPTRWELVTAVGIGLLRGLAAAHDHVDDRGEPTPILHRDVSPHNVLIAVRGPARLIDFGLALAADRMTAPTPPGTAKGKLAYLSPEVARGEPATPASDQFAAASVLWEALVGRKLFDGADEAEVFRAVATAEVEPLSRYRSDVPRALQKAIARALEADPADRFPSARAMALELGEILKGARLDLWGLLSHTVVAARAALDMGGRTQALVGGVPPEEESDVAIPLLFKSAWRRLKSHIPFLGGTPRPRELPQMPGPEATPTSEVRRANAKGVLRLQPGDEAETDGPRLRLLPDLSGDTPSVPTVRLEVSDAGETEEITIEVPGQVVYLRHLITALSVKRETVSLRVTPVRAGLPMLLFPYVPVVIGELTIEVTGVGDAKVFLSLTRDEHRPENMIVAMSDGEPAFLERTGYRITVERLAPPWVTVRVDEIDEPEASAPEKSVDEPADASGELVLRDDDIIEV